MRYFIMVIAILMVNSVSANSFPQYDRWAEAYHSSAFIGVVKIPDGVGTEERCLPGALKVSNAKIIRALKGRREGEGISFNVPRGCDIEATTRYYFVILYKDRNKEHRDTGELGTGQGYQSIFPMGEVAMYMETGEPWGEHTFFDISRRSCFTPNNSSGFRWPIVAYDVDGRSIRALADYWAVVRSIEKIKKGEKYKE